MFSDHGVHAAHTLQSPVLPMEYDNAPGARDHLDGQSDLATSAIDKDASCTLFAGNANYPDPPLQPTADLEDEEERNSPVVLPAIPIPSSNVQHPNSSADPRKVEDRSDADEAEQQTSLAEQARSDALAAEAQSEQDLREEATRHEEHERLAEIARQEKVKQEAAEQEAFRLEKEHQERVRLEEQERQERLHMQEQEAATREAERLEQERFDQLRLEEEERSRFEELVRLEEEGKRKQSELLAAQDREKLLADEAAAKEEAERNAAQVERERTLTPATSKKAVGYDSKLTVQALFDQQAQQEDQVEEARQEIARRDTLRIASQSHGQMPAPISRLSHLTSISVVSVSSHVPLAPDSPRSELSEVTTGFDSPSVISLASHVPAAPESPRYDPEGPTPSVVLPPEDLLLSDARSEKSVNSSIAPNAPSSPGHEVGSVPTPRLEIPGRVSWDTYNSLQHR